MESPIPFEQPIICYNPKNQRGMFRWTGQDNLRIFSWVSISYFLFIHLVSIDLTPPEITGVQLTNKLQSRLHWYNVLILGTTLIFSSLLPRLHWHSISPLAIGNINIKRPKVNKAIDKLNTSEVFGCYIYHDKAIDNSEIKNYVKNWPASLQMFLNKSTKVYSVR